MALYELDVILAAPAQAGVVRLSGNSIRLIGAALESMTPRYAWEDSADPATWDAIEAAVSRAYFELWRNSMIGMIGWFPTSLPPQGMLVCDGSIQARTDYPALYEVIGVEYRIDADNFRLPNLRGAFVRGSGVGVPLASTGGSETVTLTEAQIPPHSHSYVPPTVNVDLESPGAPDIAAAGIGLPTSTGATGGGQPHNNLPPYEALLPCIIAR